MVTYGTGQSPADFRVPSEMTPSGRRQAATTGPHDESREQSRYLRKCLVLETLTEHGRLRFTRLGNLIGGVSHKMLTKAVRQMEADGLISRTVFPLIPPGVEYELTDVGNSLGAAFCGVWHGAERHREAIMHARKAFQERSAE